MQYEDRVAIPTPEGVEVELTLAGIGSRFIAALIDHLIKLAISIAIIIALFGFAGLVGSEPTSDAGWIAAAIFFVAIFLIWTAYDIAFETLAAGQTPGKRWTGLRVVKIGGSPVGFMASSIRNLLRFVDYIPGSYGVGMICVLVTRLNQRLGDIAAGTVVVREWKPAQAAGGAQIAAPPAPPALVDYLSSWDVSSVTPQDLVTVRRFLERRHHLTPSARAHLAAELAQKMRPKVAGAPDMHPEVFLEHLSVAKAQRA